MLSACAQEALTTLSPLPTASDIIFLSSFDGTDFATTAVDRSSKAATMSFVGSAHLDAVIKAFGTASYTAGASGSSGIKLPIDVDYAALVTGDFTIECEVYASSFFPSASLASVWGTSHISSSVWAFRINGGAIYFSSWTAGSETVYAFGDHNMVGGQSYHVAVCRFGAYIRTFVDGVMIAKDLFPVRSYGPIPPTIGLSIGCDWDLSSFGMTGNIDEMRITRGAWYRSDSGFTPATNAFGVIGPPFFVDTDTFYNARSAPYTLRPSLVVDQDTFHHPIVSPQTVSPGLVTDTDVFLVPAVTISTHWDTSFSPCALSGSNLIATNNQGTSTSAGAVADVNHSRTSGLQYYEMAATSVGGADYGIGVVVNSFFFSTLGSAGVAGIIFQSSGHIWVNGSDLGAVMPAMVSGDVYAIAQHLGRKLIWFKKVNGTPGNWNNDPTADPALAAGGIAIPVGSFVLPACTFGGTGGSGSDIITANFGQSSFVGTKPAGYESGYVA